MATLTVSLTEQAILTDKVRHRHHLARRWPTLPDVPTIAEAGIEEMPVDAWFGLFAPPRRRGDHRQDRPGGAGDRANPEVRKRIEGTFYRPVANTPAEFAALLRQEQVTWKRVDTVGEVGAMANGESE